MLVHVSVLLIVAKIIEPPSSLWRSAAKPMWGALQAPPASAFSPALAPVGVLLAVLGYAVGTVGAVVCMELMRAMSGADDVVGSPTVNGIALPENQIHPVTRLVLPVHIPVN